MWGDSVDDLAGPNPFRTGDAELETRDTASDPARFEQLAFDGAVRELQAALPGPAWARQYPLYLRTIHRPDAPVQLMIEDREHRRPVVVEPVPELIDDTPLHIETHALVAAYLMRHLLDFS